MDGMDFWWFAWGILMSIALSYVAGWRRGFRAGTSPRRRAGE